MKLPDDNQSHPVLTWIDARFPLSKLWREHASEYYAPKNLNIWYYGGGILLTVLAAAAADRLVHAYRPQQAGTGTGPIQGTLIGLR